MNALKRFTTLTAALLIMVSCNNDITGNNTPESTEGSRATSPDGKLTNEFNYGADSYENDDNYWNAHEVEVNGTYNKNFFDDGVDWIKFYGNKGEELTLETWDFYFAYTKLELFSNASLNTPFATNKRKELNANTAVKPGAKITFTVPESGYYFAKITNGKGVGFLTEYVIAVTKDDLRDYYEEDDSPAYATLIKGGMVSESYSYNFADDDSDWIEFEAAAGRNYTIHSVSPYVDTIFTLYDSSLNFITTDDNGGQDNGSQIIIKEAGTYYLHITNTGEKSTYRPANPYNLQIISESQY